MSFKTLDPIKEYRSKQFRALPVVDLAATYCAGPGSGGVGGGLVGDSGNLSSNLSSRDFHHKATPAEGGGGRRLAPDGSSSDGSSGSSSDKATAAAAAAAARLNRAAGALAVLKCVLRTLSPVSICGRLPGRDGRVEDGEAFYDMVLGPQDQLLPREVCRLTNAHFHLLEAAAAAGAGGYDSSSRDASPAGRSPAGPRAQSPAHSLLLAKHQQQSQQPQQQQQQQGNSRVPVVTDSSGSGGG